MTQTTELAKKLISQPSVTPNDHNCQKIIADYLEPLGFKIQHLHFGEVKNLWARHGTKEPLFVFAGHTDVVPTGPEDQWSSPPFSPTIKNNHLYGRGAADMKGSVAAMVIACEQFIKTHPNYDGSIALLLTSDEEGPALDGTVKIIEYLKSQNEKIKWALVGEPTSEKYLGDIIKNGRRGSLSGKLIIHGKQGHIAYPHLADNPIHTALPALVEFIQYTWDEGNDFFPATSFQISNIHAGTGANNVIPGQLEINFNFRFSPETTPEKIKNYFNAILDLHHLKYELTWAPPSHPFITQPGELIQACKTAIEKIIGKPASLSTSGGTSDARFIATHCEEVIELGPCNQTIHQIDENINLNDLENLAKLYQEILQWLFKN